MKYELFTALVPKINIGIYIGKTIIDIRILFLFKLIVKAAAIEPIKLIVGVPMISVMNRTKDVVTSSPKIIDIIGAIITTGKIDRIQCDKILKIITLSIYKK